MRTPFICRQCLSRLQHTPARSQQILRSAYHDLARTDRAEATVWPLPNPNNNRYDPVAVDEGSSGSSELSPDNQQNSFRRYVPSSKNHVGLASGSNPRIRLKRQILGTHGKPDYLQNALADTYGLSRPAARDAIAQLKRLLYGCNPLHISDRVDEFDTWKAAYASELYKSLQDPLLRPSTSKNSEWAALSNDQDMSGESMRTTWYDIDQVQRETNWGRMIISALQVNPKLLMPLLQATYDASWSPSYIVEDVARLLFRHAKVSGALERRSFVDLVLFLLDSSPKGNLMFGEDVLASVISWAKLDQVVAIFQYLRLSMPKLTTNTLLHFAARFASSSEHKALAAEILCYMTELERFDINSPAAASVCTSLLNVASGQPAPQGDAAPDRLFKTLLEHGLRPNLLNFTALMRNFAATGHLETAWTVFDLLGQYGIEADDQVYSILLNASKKENDVSSISRVIDSVNAQDRGRPWNVNHANHLLDILYRDNESQDEIRRGQRKHNNAFRLMLQLYAKVFKLRPLQKFLPFDIEELLLWQGPSSRYSTAATRMVGAVPPQTIHSLADPDSTTLTLMITAHYRSLGKPQHIFQTYKHYNELLARRDSHAMAVAQQHGTLVHDMFLKAIMQFRPYLGYSVRTVQGMLIRAEEEETRQREHSGGATSPHAASKKHPYPSVYTWTTLINGFRNHRLPEPAFSILRKMVQEGRVQPNTATWNALIGAYARVGNVVSAVKTMRYLEAAGFQSDRYTVRAMESLKRNAREQAVELLEASKAQSLDEARADLAKLGINIAEDGTASAALGLEPLPADARWLPAAAVTGNTIPSTHGDDDSFRLHGMSKHEYARAGMSKKR
ncbi:pentatricopeptide repeat protein [Apiospora sp. TS-2023a]